MFSDKAKELLAVLVEWVNQIRESDGHPLSKDPQDVRKILESYDESDILAVSDFASEHELLRPLVQVVALDYLRRNKKITDWEFTKAGPDGFICKVRLPTG